MYAQTTGSDAGKKRHKSQVIIVMPQGFLRIVQMTAKVQTKTKGNHATLYVKISEKHCHIKMCDCDLQKAIHHTLVSSYRQQLLPDYLSRETGFYGVINGNYCPAV